mgnify:CR=1 FL=1
MRTLILVCSIFLFSTNAFASVLEQEINEKVQTSEKTRDCATATNTKTRSFKPYHGNIRPSLAIALNLGYLYLPLVGVAGLFGLGSFLQGDIFGGIISCGITVGFVTSMVLGSMLLNTRTQQDRGVMNMLTGLGLFIAHIAWGAARPLYFAEKRKRPQTRHRPQQSELMATTLRLNQNPQVSSMLASSGNGLSYAFRF